MGTRGGHGGRGDTAGHGVNMRAWGHRVGDTGTWRHGDVEVWGHQGTQKTHGGHGDLGDWGHEGGNTGEHGGTGRDMGIIVGRGAWGTQEARGHGDTGRWGWGHSRAAFTSSLGEFPSSPSTVLLGRGIVVLRTPNKSS